MKSGRATVMRWLTRMLNVFFLSSMVLIDWTMCDVWFPCIKEITVQSDAKQV